MWIQYRGPLVHPLGDNSIWRRTPVCGVSWCNMTPQTKSDGITFLTAKHTNSPVTNVISLFWRVFLCIHLISIRIYVNLPNIYIILGDRHYNARKGEIRGPRPDWQQTGRQHFMPRLAANRMPALHAPTGSKHDASTPCPDWQQTWRQYSMLRLAENRTPALHAPTDSKHDASTPCPDWQQTWRQHSMPRLAANRTPALHAPTGSKYDASTPCPDWQQTWRQYSMLRLAANRTPALHAPTGSKHDASTPCPDWQQTWRQYSMPSWPECICVHSIINTNEVLRDTPLLCCVVFIFYTRIPKRHWSWTKTTLNENTATNTSFKNWCKNICHSVKPSTNALPTVIISQSSSVIPHNDSSISWFNIIQQYIIGLNMDRSRNKWNAISVMCRVMCDHAELQTTSPPPPVLCNAVNRRVRRVSWTPVNWAHPLCFYWVQPYLSPWVKRPKR
jgi:hypothetical protein